MCHYHKDVLGLSFDATAWQNPVLWRTCAYFLRHPRNLLRWFCGHAFEFWLLAVKHVAVLLPQVWVNSGIYVLGDRFYGSAYPAGTLLAQVDVHTSPKVFMPMSPWITQDPIIIWGSLRLFRELGNSDVTFVYRICFSHQHRKQVFLAN